MYADYCYVQLINSVILLQEFYDLISQINDTLTILHPDEDHSLTAYDIVDFERTLASVSELLIIYVQIEDQRYYSIG